ncbi:MAG: Flp family type IVb pilin [Chloroflexota bacterium]
MSDMRLRRSLTDDEGLATVEYIVGAAVVLGTLVLGISSWNNGLVSRLEALVTQMQAVR